MAEFPKRYDPKSVERKWYQRWRENRVFVANPIPSSPPFSIVMPPPNITGVLTLGHVLNNSIQDILARRARMQGFEVLWLPGVDHAGIGTQTAVEKDLRRTENKTRHVLGREEFLRRGSCLPGETSTRVLKAPHRDWVLRVRSLPRHFAGRGDVSGATKRIF